MLEFGNAKSAVAKWLAAREGYRWDDLPYEYEDSRRGKLNFLADAEDLLEKATQLTTWKQELLRRYGPLPQGVIQ